MPNTIASLISNAQVLFDYCPSEALDFDYRRQLLLQELLGYEVARGPSHLLPLACLRGRRSRSQTVSCLGLKASRFPCTSTRPSVQLLPPVDAG
eukprot:scaffold62117_cov23-Tisochrysis_lutea.AAC.2